MTLTRRQIDEFANAMLGRRLSRAELDDVARQCGLINLRAGDDAFLLELVRHRDLLTRVEAISREAAGRQSLTSAIKRLRGWVIASAVAASVIGVVIYDTGYDRGYAFRDRMIALDLAWTTTSAGQGARLLYDVGIIPFLIGCAVPGWSQIENLCVPGIDPVSKRMFGVPNRRPEPPA